MPGWSAAARGLTPIPPQTEGPFYPQPADRPADTDRDLVKIEGAVREAGGEVLHLTGRVVGPGGKPLPGRAVEIWQCDAGGRYHHPRDGCAAERDPAFQGFGRTVTDGEGGFRFRTIRPVPYPGRTPHIHARIARPDGTWLTTQLYVAGDPGNARDWIFRRLGARGQAAASMELARNAGGDWETAIDIVL
ncbi:hypothetical protein LNKW23_06410 [Paralimibaculum aggregatum]|uniref:Intradiol ring-cleavage dioxygenases domain-containing protein n=2 Tax=Paralimibaculum aggregatum TaxID=3036245 RepID=A0ABQ6LKV7_9RHOB|nr:hypothetical protein LNKW23_06410 [Limibaculum sp. NKW23]